MNKIGYNVAISKFSEGLASIPGIKNLKSLRVWQVPWHKKLEKSEGLTSIPGIKKLEKSEGLASSLA